MGFIGFRVQGALQSSISQRVSAYYYFGIIPTLRLQIGSWDLWGGGGSAWGARVWDLTTRVQEH